MALSNNNILEAMLDRATKPTDEDIDVLAVEIFCMTIRNDPDLINEAIDLIVSKIRSPNVTQSLRALSLLEECMAKCGSTFQDVVSKFRFLNDLIRLVSKKYEGDKTPPQIREKIMDCLLLWTTEYPSKSKIREAYDLLRKEGYNHMPVKRESVMGIDEEMFRKLLQSGNADDLKRANLLIQNRVIQNARRMELVCRHKTELEEIQNTAALLSQMLDSYEQNENDKDEDSLSLIKELYESCENHLPIIERLQELIENTNEDLIVETLEINDRLRTTIDRYKSTLFFEKSSKLVAPIQPEPKVMSSDLLSGLLVQPTKATVSKPTEALNPLDELTEIFGKCDDSATSNIQKSLFDSMDLLEPITVHASEQNHKPKKNATTSPKYDFSRLKDIDILSEGLLKENLKSSEIIGTFKKEPERVSLNELAKEKTSNSAIKPTSPVSPPGKAEPVSLVSKNGVVTKSVEQVNNNSIENNSKDEVLLEAPQPEESDKTIKEEKSQPVVHLADIHVDLDDVSPTHEKLLLDDDIKITLNFTSNRPSPNVSVIVISVTNQSKLPVTSFQFDASVRKPSKIRLLPATVDSMPGNKPFRPPTPINQVMLLLNPTKSDVDVTCIVGYKLGDDPDPIKESIVAKGVAYVE